MVLGEGEHETVADKRAGVNSEVDERNPRLIVDIKLFETERPWMFDKYPTENVEDNCRRAPDER